MRKVFEDFENALLEQGIKGMITIQLEDKDFESVINHPEFDYLMLNKFGDSNLVSTNISLFTIISRNG